MVGTLRSAHDGRNRLATVGSDVEALTVRILWLFGPPGVGKSVTSWELLTLLSDRDEPTSYVDIDQLGMADPAAGDECEVHRHKAWASGWSMKPIRAPTTRWSFVPGWPR